MDLVKIEGDDERSGPIPDLFYYRMFPHFKPGEFECPCCGERGIQYYFVAMLQQLRFGCGFPIVINSAYRCESHNRTVGGAVDSYHRQGLAADISTRGIPSEDLHLLIHYVIASFHGVGVYRSHIHVDMREPHLTAFWIGSKT